MGKRFFLIDTKRTKNFCKIMFWKSGAFGYTDDIYEAGVFPLEEAIKYVEKDMDKETIMVTHESIVNMIIPIARK